MKLEKLKEEILTLIDSSSFDLAFELIKEGLSINLFDSDLYYYMGLAYKSLKNYNCAYLCFENALEYPVNEDIKNIIISEMSKLKEAELISVKDYSIVILTFNNLKYTIECIESIRKYNTYNNHEIIVIDNNSTDETPLWLKSQKDIKFVLNKENKGFPGGCNQGISEAKEHNDIFLLNNDTVVMPNSIFNLRMGLYSDKKIGATSSVSNSAPYQKINEKFESLSQYLSYSLKNNITNHESYELRLKLIGFALLLKRSVLNEVGLLDEIFTPGNYEDDDLGLRITKAGYKNILCRDSFIYHYGNISFGKMKREFLELLKNNEKKFENKWGFNALKSLSSRSDVLELIDETNDTHINILEIGCACGGTLLEIKNIYPNADIYGFEINSSAAEVAKAFANINTGDIENAPLNYNEKFFDYIIFADVLQYLKDPLKTLENMKKYLKPNGHILASITNVLNFKILKDLLNGNWAYENGGFLDNTKIKFFTYKDILKMFKESEYNNIFVTSMANVPEDNEDEEFINKISELSSYADIKEELINYEYYIKAQSTTSLVTDQKYNLKNEINIIIKELDKNFKNNNLLTHLITLIKDENITYQELIKTIENKTKNSGKILNSIAVKCFNNNLEEYAIALLEKAYALNPKDLDIAYNLNLCLSDAKINKF